MKLLSKDSTKSLWRRKRNSETFDFRTIYFLFLKIFNLIDEFLFIYDHFEILSRTIFLFFNIFNNLIRSKR
jgi:hypothetical protein